MTVPPYAITLQPAVTITLTLPTLMSVVLSLIHVMYNLQMAQIITMLILRELSH
jgi:hypothetical protein